MSLRVCVLGSGSSGNATYVASDTTAVLIDAGLSTKELTRRLCEIGEDITRINAVCITHEHKDHTAALPVLQRRHNVEIFANSGTREGVVRDQKFNAVRWNIFITGSSFEIGDLSFEPFSVPHDAYEPVAFIVRHRDKAVGVLSDMGICTNVIRERLKSVDALVLESNYDERLLTESPRPWFLKQRIMGSQGHLSNEHAAELASDVASDRLKQIFLSHLSDDCNEESIALDTTRSRLRRDGYHHIEVSPTYKDKVSSYWRAELA